MNTNLLYHPQIHTYQIRSTPYKGSNTNKDGLSPPKSTIFVEGVFEHIYGPQFLLLLFIYLFIYSPPPSFPTNSVSNVWTCHPLQGYDT
jgi:hypothetical protein